MEIIQEMLTYKSKLVKINKGEEKEWDCFMRLKDGSCYSLTISGTKLTSITDQNIWACCKDLKIVILLMNELNNLPEELSWFADTIELVCIQHNNFTKVPEIIFKRLVNIKHLNLHGNQILALPPDVKNLINLERLKCGFNKLNSLPNIFDSFKLLTEITFYYNNLTRLPPSFAQLEQLKSIDLTDNSFTSIPAPLLRLRNLKILYMEWNRIQRLAPTEDSGGSETHALLSRLDSLKLKGNPIYMHLEPHLDKCSLLKLVTDRSTFSELHEIPMSRALRVLVLGSCGAGKTSIVEALNFDTYVTPTSEAHHDHTVGIKRYSIPFRMRDSHGKDIIIELRLWDFAGERSYIMMNNLFLSEGTLVWIAVNFEMYECTDESFHKNVASWLQQVVTKTIRPVVWIIGTHTDKCTIEEANLKRQHIYDKTNKTCVFFEKETTKELQNLECRAKKQEYKLRSPHCVDKKVKDLTELKKSNVPTFVKDNLKVMYLTNTYLFTGFSELRGNIESLLQIESFRQFAKPLSVKQQKAADRLREKAEDMLSKNQTPMLPEKEVFYILNSELSSEEADHFLEYLCQIGELLICRQNSDPKNIHAVILDVDWLINLLKQIFHHNFEAMINEKRRTCTEDFFNLNDEEIQLSIESQQTTGIVHHRLLQALWPLHVIDELTELLENIELAYKTTDPSGCLFPWLITQNCPDPIVSYKEHIMVSYDFSPCLPVCFIQKLAVRFKKHTAVSIEAVYKNGLIIHAIVNSTELLIHISTSVEANSMRGRVYILTCVLDKISTVSECTNELWYATTIVIRLIEMQLSSWTFYSSLQRKVYCPYCSSYSWHLQIKDSTPNKGSGPMQPAFKCRKCNKKVPKNLIVLPPEHLLKPNDYVDISELFEKLTLGHEPNPIPANQLQTSSQFRSQNSQYNTAQQFYSAYAPNVGTPPPYSYSPSSYGHSPPSSLLGPTAIACFPPDPQPQLPAPYSPPGTQPPLLAFYSPHRIQPPLMAAYSSPETQPPLWAACSPPGTQQPIPTGSSLAAYSPPGTQQPIPTGSPLAAYSPPGTSMQPIIPTGSPQIGFSPTGLWHNVHPGISPRQPQSAAYIRQPNPNLKHSTRHSQPFVQQHFHHSHQTPHFSLPRMQQQQPPQSHTPSYQSRSHHPVGPTRSLPLSQVDSLQQSWLHRSYPPPNEQSLSNLQFPICDPNARYQTMDSTSTVTTETYSSSEQLAQADLFTDDMEMDTEGSTSNLVSPSLNPVVKSQGLRIPLEVDDIWLVARHTVATQNDWKILLQCLGLSEKPRIKERIFEKANDASCRPPLATELIYQVLWEWIYLQGPEATVGVLAKAIIRAGMESSWTIAFTKLLDKLKQLSNT